MGHDNDQYDGTQAASRTYTSGAQVNAVPEAVPAFAGYDLLDVPLGDLMRGERATLGKSLLDVERELRIRATYIAAIENSDIGAFQSQGFIAGYVRSYARYLNIDPEWTFRRFCEETGFRGIHGTAAQGGAGVKRTVAMAPRRMDPNEVMSSSRISYAPTRESLFSKVEPGALGSVAVLLVLALGIGYGAWAILNDIQRLQIAPIDEAPAIPLAQLDPLVGVRGPANTTPSATGEGAPVNADTSGGGTLAFDIALPGPETGSPLYRPQALEAPLLTPRDGALATLDPNEVGTLAAPVAEAAPTGVAPQSPAATGTVQVTSARADEVMLFATRPTWVRVYTAAGDTIEEVTLNAGDSYTVPADVAAPLLRTGNAGSLYFAVNGVALGPSGVGATIVRDVDLTADAITATFQLADTEADPDLTQVASLLFDATTVPDVAPVVPQAPAPAATAYNPTGPAAPEVATSPYADLPPEVAAALVAANALPVRVSAPDPTMQRPAPRP